VFQVQDQLHQIEHVAVVIHVHHEIDVPVRASFAAGNRPAHPDVRSSMDRRDPLHRQPPLRQLSHRRRRFSVHIITIAPASVKVGLPGKTTPSGKGAAMLAAAGPIQAVLAC
jgi:hypothetical protein